MKDKLTKVVHKKLGKENAWGLCYKDRNEIHIDSRLKGRDYFQTICHELIHNHCPDLIEEKVEDLSTRLFEDLWALGFRKTDL